MKRREPISDALPFQRACAPRPRADRLRSVRQDSGTTLRTEAAYARSMASGGGFFSSSRAGDKAPNLPNVPEGPLRTTGLPARDAVPL